MNKKILLRSIAALAAVGLATPLMLRLAAADHKAVAAAATPAVTVSPAEGRILVETAEFTGRVEATEQVDLRAEVGGRIVAIHFQAGQHVDAGAPLFTIDPRSYVAIRNAAAAAVARAEALASTAATERARAERLLERSAISTEQADTRRSQAAEAAANLAAAKAELEKAELDLERTEVRAPIAGRVARAQLTVGNLVSPSNLLTTLVSDGPVFVYADLPEATLLRFQRLERDGQLPRDPEGHVKVELQLNDESAYRHRGYIESADTRIAQGTGTLTVRMLFPNTEAELMPGLFGRVRLPLGAPTETVLVSERAIGTDQSQRFVFTVAEDGRVNYRTVQLGGKVDDKRIVRSGLQPGERVIVNGTQRVRPGMTVAAQLETHPVQVAQR